MALLGSMVAVMVLLFSAIIFLHRRQHRANKETFLGFYGESSERAGKTAKLGGQQCVEVAYLPGAQAACWPNWGVFRWSTNRRLLASHGVGLAVLSVGG